MLQEMGLAFNTKMWWRRFECVFNLDTFTHHRTDSTVFHPSQASLGRIHRPRRNDALFIVDKTITLMLDSMCCGSRRVLTAAHALYTGNYSCY